MEHASSTRNQHSRVRFGDFVTIQPGPAGELEWNEFRWYVELSDEVSTQAEFNSPFTPLLLRCR